MNAVVLEGLTAHYLLSPFLSPSLLIGQMRSFVALWVNVKMYDCFDFLKQEADFICLVSTSLFRPKKYKTKLLDQTLHSFVVELE
jgi:hypothetical protein